MSDDIDADRTITRADIEAAILRPCAYGCILGWPGGASTQGGCRHLRARGLDATKQLMVLGAEIQRLRAQRDAALEEQRSAVARLAEVSADRDRLLAAAVAQADAAGSPIASRFEGHVAWLAATTATEALASELRGAR